MKRTLLWLPLFVVLLPGRTFAQDAIVNALAAHGGAAVNTVNTIQITGTSTVGTTNQPVTISASFDGNVRFDYGTPVTRSYVNNPQGAFEVINGVPRWKQAHVGAFAQLDMLGVFGIRHLALAGVQRTVQSPGLVNGRATNRMKAQTGRNRVNYRRTYTDDTDVHVDQATGLVLEITRTHMAERDMDLKFVAGFRFANYQTVNGLQLPFQIQRVMDGVVRETITVQNIQLNPTFPANFFTR